MYKVVFILFFITSCQTQKPKNTRAVLSKELSEYSYTVNSWSIENKKILNFTNKNIFLNDYLNSASKERPPRYLVYYFEDIKMNYALKLKITIGDSTEPLTKLEVLKADKLGCSKKQFSDEDFRRQSCYLLKAEPKINNLKIDLNTLYDRIVLEVVNN